MGASNYIRSCGETRYETEFQQVHHRPPSTTSREALPLKSSSLNHFFFHKFFVSCHLRVLTVSVCRNTRLRESTFHTTKRCKNSRFDRDRWETKVSRQIGKRSSWRMIHQGGAIPLTGGPGSSRRSHPRDHAEFTDAQSGRPRGVQYGVSVCVNKAPSQICGRGKETSIPSSDFRKGSSSSFVNCLFEFSREFPLRGSTQRF